MSENPQDLVGQQVGNYHLIDWLGRGGFADVYLGEHIHLKTQGAIKMLHVELSHKALKDFFNEARTIARLRHPNIIQMLDYGVEHGNPFLVVTYAPSGSLRQHFLPGKPIAPEQVVPIVQQVASALDYAHRKRLIHRDIKPANMLLGPENQVLLSDFGLAVVAQSTSPQIAREVGGTVAYMAPEQLQGKARFASDQYALGIATYEWLCGERPFNGTFTEIASQHMIIPPPSLREKIPRLPAAVERVVFKALAKKPAQRYENVTVFANALHDACKDPKLTATHIFAVQLPSPLSKTPSAPAEKSPLLVPTKPTPQRSRPPGTIRRTALVLAAMLTMIAGSMGLWYGFTHFHTLMQHPASATGQHNLTPIAKNDGSTTKSTNSIGTVNAPGGVLSTSATPTPIPPSSSISEPDCLTGSPSHLAFFAQSNSFPFPTQTLTLTNCGGTITAWSYSEQTDNGTQFDVTAPSKSIALHESEQVQISLISKGTGTHQGSITFTKGSATWTISVSYTIN
ncbi:MAG TPA: protein kinase [Ktedonobacteraceae bacterium]|jgi:serine/threonine protein kinase